MDNQEPREPPAPEELQLRLQADDPKKVRQAINELRIRAADEPKHLLDAVGHIVDNLNHTDREVRASAARAIAAAASIRASQIKPHLSTVAACFDDDYDLVQWNALKVFSSMSPEDREAVRSHVDNIAAFLNADFREARRDAAFCLGNLAEEYPEEVVSAVPGLVAEFEESYDDVSRSEDIPIQMKRDVERDPDEQFENQKEAVRNGRVVAGHGLFKVATVAPAVVADHLTAIESTLTDEDPLVRKTAADIIFGLASEDPETTVSCIDQLGDRLSKEPVTEIRESIVQALNAISVAAPDAVGTVVVQRSTPIREALDAEDASVRGAAASLCALGAERDSAAVEPAADRLRELREIGDEEYVREAATAALANL